MLSLIWSFYQLCISITCYFISCSDHMTLFCSRVCSCHAGFVLHTLHNCTHLSEHLWSIISVAVCGKQSFQTWTVWLLHFSLRWHRVSSLHGSYKDIYPTLLITPHIPVLLLALSLLFLHSLHPPLCPLCCQLLADPHTHACNCLLPAFSEVTASSFHAFPAPCWSPHSFLPSLRS